VKSRIPIFLKKNFDTEISWETEKVMGEYLLLKIDLKEML
jgi:hypothetical protein